MLLGRMAHPSCRSACLMQVVQQCIISNLVPPARAAYHGMSHAELLIGLAASIGGQKKTGRVLCQERFPSISGVLTLYYAVIKSLVNA